MSKKERDFIPVKFLLEANDFCGALVDYFATSPDWFLVEKKIVDNVQIADVYEYKKNDLNIVVIIPSTSDPLWRDHTVQVMDCVIRLIFQRKLPPEVQSDIMSEIRKKTSFLG